MTLWTGQSPEFWKAFCGSDAWCHRMAGRTVADDRDAVHQTADEVFGTLDADDWRQAFAAHPRIGDLDSLRMKFAGNCRWSSGEQSGMAGVDERTLRDLQTANETYFERFGYIFIICATGRSADEMLSACRSRLAHGPAEELPVAAAEQRKITHLRIDKHDREPETP